MTSTFTVRRRKIVPLALTLLAMALGGCLRDRDNREDPLTGSPARIPASRSSVSTREQDNPNAPSLSIRDSNPPPDRNNVQTTGWTGSNNNNSSTDSGPRLQAPVVGYDQRNSGTPAALSGTRTATRFRTFEEGEAFLMRLTENRCKSQRLLQHEDEQNQGVWTFECSVQSKTNPSNVKTYTATDKFGLYAMQKVIDDIVRDQGR